MRIIKGVKILCFLVVFLSLTSACEKLLIKDERAQDPQENFEYLWEQVWQKYAYFELKNVDWLAMRAVYQSKIHPEMSEDSLFIVLRDLLFELRDDHTNLITPFNVAAYRIAWDFPKNFNERTLIDNYFNRLAVNVTGSFRHTKLKDYPVGYIRYSSFMQGVSASDWEAVLKNYENEAGIVLDLRENGGGNILNIARLFAPFVQSTTQVAFLKTKNGPEPNDFSSPIAVQLAPGNYQYPKKIVVLVDRGSYSATTSFALYTKAFNHITLVGDTTGGGGGLPNGGQLPNGWTYRFSVSQLLDLNMDAYPEQGVPPDVHALFDWLDLAKDEVLEAALASILP